MYYIDIHICVMKLYDRMYVIHTYMYIIDIIQSMFFSPMKPLPGILSAESKRSARTSRRPTTPCSGAAGAV